MALKGDPGYFWCEAVNRQAIFAPILAASISLPPMSLAVQTAQLIDHLP